MYLNRISALFLYEITLFYVCEKVFANINSTYFVYFMQ